MTVLGTVFIGQEKLLCSGKLGAPLIFLQPNIVLKVASIRDNILYLMVMKYVI